MTRLHTPRYRLGARVLIAGRYGNVERIDGAHYLVRCDDGSEGWVAESEIEVLPTPRGAAA